MRVETTPSYGFVNDPKSDTAKPVKKLTLQVAGSQTDAALIAAVADKRIVVLQAIVSSATAASSFTMKTKPSGAGSAISTVTPTAAATAGPHIFSDGPIPWWTTNKSEGLSVDTGAGGAVNFDLWYFESDMA